MGCLGLIAMVVAFVAVIMLVVFGAMKSSDAYKVAVARAKADPQVTTALGTPISEGLFMSGHTNVNGGSGEADLAIPISGPKGKATIYAVATKSGGESTYVQANRPSSGRWRRNRSQQKLSPRGDVTFESLINFRQIRATPS